MRFTSPDPIASPFYNLHHYAGNSPGRYYDPDGLQSSGRMSSRWVSGPQRYSDYDPDEEYIKPHWQEAAEFLAWEHKPDPLFIVAGEKVQAGGARAIDFLAQFPWNDLNAPVMPDYRHDPEAEKYGYNRYDSDFEKFAKRRDYSAGEAKAAYVASGGSPWVADAVGFGAELAGGLAVDALLFGAPGAVMRTARWGRLRYMGNWKTFEREVMHQAWRRGETVIHTQYAGGRGLDFASFTGRGKNAQLFLNETKNHLGRVPTRSYTSFGLGKSGRRTFDMNMDAAINAIKRSGLDRATRRTLLAQARSGGARVRLWGNGPRGTHFSPADIYSIERSTGLPVTTHWIR